MVDITIKTNQNLYNKKIKQQINIIINELSINENLNINPSFINITLIPINTKMQAFVLSILGVQDEYFIMFTSDSISAGRNTYIAQNFAAAYKNYLISYTNTKFKIYLLENAQHSAPSINFQIRCLKTIFGNKVFINNKPIDKNNNDTSSLSDFNSLVDLKVAKYLTSERNTGNNPTYIFEDQNNITIMGKFDGANYGDTMILIVGIYTIIQRTNDNRFFSIIPYQEQSNKVSSIITSENITTVKNKFGIVVEDTLRLYDKEALDDENAEIRNQKRFKINLIKKFGYQYCALCGCKIGKLIIASHIHRVADIKSSNLSLTDKQTEATHQDNGLWLCANHDKMFEYGLITLKDDGAVVTHLLDDNDKDYYDTITTNTMLNRVFINQDFIKFLQHHHQRIGYKST